MICEDHNSENFMPREASGPSDMAPMRAGEHDEAQRHLKQQPTQRKLPKTTHHPLSSHSQIHLKPTAISTPSKLLLLLLMAAACCVGLVAAHSRISTVWLAKEEPSASSAGDGQRKSSASGADSSSAQPPPPPTDSRQLLERSGDSWLPSTSPSAQFNLFTGTVQNLQASSSSLQPAIASMDTSEASPASERRSDASGEQLAYQQTGRGQAGNLSAIGYPSSAEASSLDRLWTMNQTNAEVQFDEEHHQMNPKPTVGFLSPSSSLPSSGGQKFGARRHRPSANETTTSFNYEAAPSVAAVELEADGFPRSASALDQYQPPINSSHQLQNSPNYYADQATVDKQGPQMSTYAFNASHIDATNGSTTTFNYNYLPNDREAQQQQQHRWAPTSYAGSSAEAGDSYANDQSINPNRKLIKKEKRIKANRRKLHNSGTQYDLRHELVGEDQGAARDQELEVRRFTSSRAPSARPPTYNQAELTSGQYQQQIGERLLSNGRAPQPSVGESYHSVDQRYYHSPISQELPFQQLPFGTGSNQPEEQAQQHQHPTQKAATTPAPIHFPGSGQQATSAYSSPRPTPSLDYHLVGAGPGSGSNAPGRVQQLITRPPRELTQSRLSPGSSSRPTGSGRPLLISSSRREASWPPLRTLKYPQQLAYPSLDAMGQRSAYLSSLSPHMFTGGYHPNNIYSNYHYPLQTGGPIWPNSQPRTQKRGQRQPQQQPKRSLLGSLRNLVDPGGSNKEQNKLEDSFYHDQTSASQQQRVRSKLKRLPASIASGLAGGPNWQTANLYYLDSPVPALLQPPLLHGSHQYYGHEATSGAGARPSAAAGLLSSPLAYYPHSYLAGDGQLQPAQLVVRQPTVAPAPSSQLDKFYSAPGQSIRFPGSGGGDSHLGQSSHHSSRFVAARGGADHHNQQQPANFIPVVAVSVTKTSPAPKPLEPPEISPSALDQSPELHPELVDYLEMKTSDGRFRHGHRQAQRQRQANGFGGRPPAMTYRDGSYMLGGHRHERDYGNLASGSGGGRDHALYSAHGGRRHRNTRQQPPPHNQMGGGTNGQRPEQTTTVKSAVFGYLPNEAHKPMMQAMGMLPRYSPPIGAKDYYSYHLESPADLSANLLPGDYPRAASAHHELIGLDEPPSLGLQLQANSFAQNDIAHPFLHHPHQTSPTHPAAAAADSASSSIRKVYAAPASGLMVNSNQQHHSGHQSYHRATQQQPASLGSSPIEVYPTNQHQYHGFQFLQPSDAAALAEMSLASPSMSPFLSNSGAGSGHHPGAVTNQILTAAATELNPLLPVMFAASPGYAIQPDGQQQPGATGSSGSPDDDSDSDQSNGTLNKNKKRSSDFFANAGQLLLSALPILLAPALGLMFASSPLPVARYQAPSTFTGSGSMHSSIPGSYLESLNQGQVSNAPQAQLFTPSPPGYNLTTTTTSTSARPNGRPANSSLRQPATRGRPTPLPQKLTVTLTTLGPPVFVNETVEPPQSPPNGLTGSENDPFQDSAASGQLLNSYNSQNSSYLHNQQQLANGSSSKVQTIDHHHHHHHLGNTVLLLTNDDIDDLDAATGSGNDRASTNHLEPGASSSSNSSSELKIEGYEGVDYDAQFANLRKSALPVRHKQSTDSLGSNMTNRVGTNNSYHAAASDRFHLYSELPPASAPADPTPNKPQVIRAPAGGKPSARPAVEESDTSTRLYPVSTWPPMRRRTVSLVTSNGNKTLLDASEKYPAADYYNSPASGATQKQPPATGYNATSHTTFDDSATDSELSLEGYNLAPASGSTGDSSEGKNSTKGGVHRDAIDFMFTDGHSTVSLTREPVGLRAARASSGSSAKRIVKREAGGEPEVIAPEAVIVRRNASRIAGGRPIKLIKRVVRFMKPAASGDSSRALDGAAASLEAAASSMAANTTDQLELGGFSPAASGNSSAEGEMIKSEASRSKTAHVVASVVAHLADEALEEELEAQRMLLPPPIELVNASDAEFYRPAAGQRFKGRKSAPVEAFEQPSIELDGDLVGGSNASSTAAEKLEELLARKRAILERVSREGPLRNRQPQVVIMEEDAVSQEERDLPPRSNSTARESSGKSEGDKDPEPAQAKNSTGSQPDRSEQQLNLPPIEVTATRIKVFQAAANGSVEQQVSNGTSLQRAASRVAEPLELSDETRRALAKFGAMVIKDSLQIAENSSSTIEEDGTRNKSSSSNKVASLASSSNRNEKQVKRWKIHPADSLEFDEQAAERRAPRPQDVYETDAGGSLATERSFTRMSPLDGVTFGSSAPAREADGAGFVGAREAIDQASRLRQPQRRRNSSADIGRRRHPLPTGPTRQVASLADDFYADDANLQTERPLQARHKRVRDRVNLVENDNRMLFSPTDDRSGSEDSGGDDGDYYQSGTGHGANSFQPSDYKRFEHASGSHTNRSSGFSMPFENPYDRFAPINGSRSIHANEQRRNEPSPSSYGNAYYSGSRNHYNSNNNNEGNRYNSSQHNRRDSSLHQPQGYMYDMRNNPPDPVRPHNFRSQPTQPPALAELQSAPFNVTTYAPSHYSRGYQNNRPSGGYSSHSNHHPRNSYMYNNQQDRENGYAAVPNGAFNRPDFIPSNSYPQSHPYNQNNHYANSHYGNQQSSGLYSTRYQSSPDNYRDRDSYSTATKYPSQRNNYQPDPSGPFSPGGSFHGINSFVNQGGSMMMSSSLPEKTDTRAVNDYLKRVQFSDSDRDKLMASYLTCDGLLNDNDHCLERLSCEFSDPQNIERANKLDRAVSSILLGHILINTYIPNHFKLRLKSASLFGYTQSGKCSRYACNKLSRPQTSAGL